MFHFVEKEQHFAYKKDLELMFAKLSQMYGYPVGDHFDHEDTIYILCKVQLYGLIGAARLVPFSVQDYVHERLWECNRIEMFSPDLAHEEDLDESIYHRLPRMFYPNLYAALQQFALKNQIPEIIVHASEEEQEDIKFYGRWPLQGEYQMPNGDWASQMKINAEGPVFFQDEARFFLK